jgi:N-acetylneuraminic acid mutarotase
VMGGFIDTALEVTQRIDIYDPTTDSWRLGPDLPGAETHVGVANVGKGLILAGGFDGNVIDRVVSKAVWRWHADDETWTAGPDLPLPRAAVSAALIGSEFHVAAGLAEDGETDSGDHFVWDLEGSGGWTTADALPVPRNHGGGATSGGLFFAVAGRHNWDEYEGHVATVDAFDPATGSWTERAPIPIARSEIGASTSAMSDGRLLVIGGSVEGKHPSADVFVYDPAADVWSSLPPIPSVLKGTVAARIGDKIIVSTGSPTSRDPSTTTYIGCCL